MGIAILVIGTAIFNIGIFAGIIYGALKIIEYSGRPGAGDRAHVIILGLGGLTIVGALVLGTQLKSGGSTVTEHNWAERYCDGDVGEHVYRTVENVEGIYYLPPQINHSGGRFHERDADSRTWLERPTRLYDFFEVRYNTDQLVMRHERKDNKVVSLRKDDASARYAFTWTPISTQKDVQAGVHGEELEVFDRQTGEVLGRRVLYLYASAQRTGKSGAPVPVCPQANLPADGAYIDGQPRDSYRFVSKILKPPALTTEEAARIFDLSRGGGSHRKRCLPIISIGPGLAPGDIQYEKQGNNLYIQVPATGDSLNCVDFLSPWSNLPSGKFAPLRFADGGLIPAHEYIEKVRPINPPYGR